MIINSSGNVIVGAGGSIPTYTPPAGRSLLTTADMTWLGQAKIPADGSSGTASGGTAYMGPAMAIRYVGGQRRLITAHWTSAPATGYFDAGDLVEWSFPTLYQGAVSGASSMTKVRQWSNWADATSLNIGTPSTGVRLGGLWWDEDQGVIWYVAYAYYAGNNRPFLGATALHDNGTVTKYGMWYYRTGDISGGNQYSQWKGVGGWVLKIPAYAQAACGEMGIGAPALGTIGTYGQKGIGLHTLPTFPPLSDAAGTVLSLGTRCLDYSEDYKTTTNAEMHTHNTVYEPIGSTHGPGYYRLWNGSAFTNSDDPTTWATGGLTLGANDGDILYIGLPSGDNASALYLQMTTPAVGGTRVWEYSKTGGTWGALSPSFAVGDAALTGTDNAGYWTTPPADFTTAAVNGVTTRWIRIRNTAAFSTAGAISKSGSKALCDPTLANPAPEASYGYWQFSRENVNGFAWVDTGTKHGILCFGRQPRGKTWYGVSKAYTSTGALAEDTRVVALNAYGYHTDNDTARLYVIDPDDVIAAANGDTLGNASDTNPAAEYDWHAEFPDIPDTVEGQAWISAYQGNGCYWDATAGELIWVHATSWWSGAGTASRPTVQVFAIA